MPYAYFLTDNAAFPAAAGEINALLATANMNGHAFLRLADRIHPPLSGDAALNQIIYLCTRQGAVVALATGTIGPLVEGPTPAIVQPLYGLAPGQFRQLNGLHALNPPLNAQQIGWTNADEQTFLQGRAYCRHW